jgi:hypothetical protein
MLTLILAHIGKLLDHFAAYCFEQGQRMTGKNSKRLAMSSGR